jgi:hypothetical protein
MVKRALTSYDTVCWPDRLSLAQEMRESQKYVGVDNQSEHDLEHSFFYCSGTGLNEQAALFLSALVPKPGW